MSSLRQLVLQSFKNIHRARIKVFAGDERTLEAARNKINEEYSKHKHINDRDAITAMIKYSNDVANELKTQVIQAKEIEPGVYKAKITEDTVKLNNIPYNEAAISEDNVGQSKPCCQGGSQNN